MTNPGACFNRHKPYWVRLFVRVNSEIWWVVSGWWLSLYDIGSTEATTAWAPFIGESQRSDKNTKNSWWIYPFNLAAFLPWLLEKAGCIVLANCDWYIMRGWRSSGNSIGGCNTRWRISVKQVKNAIDDQPWWINVWRRFRVRYWQFFSCDKTSHSTGYMRINIR